jgi:hypothetical protein
MDGFTPANTTRHCRGVTPPPQLSIFAKISAHLAKLLFDLLLALFERFFQLGTTPPNSGETQNRGYSTVKQVK